MRAELARLFVEKSAKPVIYDEFTSVVDRQVAQVSSYAISKFIRRKDKQFIAVSCHRDIINWLNPDWVYDTDSQSFSWRSLRRRPEIKLDIRYAKSEEWTLFSQYHYLSSSHNNSADKYIAEINGVPVAWCSVLHMPHSRNKKLKRIHRLVVRPDYQGLGIGFKLLNFVAEIYRKKHFDVHITTSLKYMTKILSKKTSWKCTHLGRKSPYGSKMFRKTESSSRLTSSYKYIGNEYGTTTNPI